VETVSPDVLWKLDCLELVMASSLSLRRFLVFFGGMVAIAVTFFAGYEVRKMGEEPNLTAADIGEKVNLGFAMQTMEFMLQAAQASDTREVNVKNEKILLTLADSLYFLDAALDTQVGRTRLKPGFCERLPQLKRFDEALGGGEFSVTPLREDSASYLKSTLKVTVSKVGKLCLN